MSHPQCPPTPATQLPLFVLLRPPWTTIPFPLHHTGALLGDGYSFLSRRREIIFGGHSCTTSSSCLASTVLSVATASCLERVAAATSLALLESWLETFLGDAAGCGYLVLAFILSLSCSPPFDTWSHGACTFPISSTCQPLGAVSHLIPSKRRCFSHHVNSVQVAQR